MISTFLRFSAAALATVLAVGAAGAWPTARLAGPDAMGALGLAAAIALFGSLLGYVPVAMRAQAPLEQRAQAFLAGMGLRLFVTLGILLGLWWGGWWGAALRRDLVFLWTGIFYVALLLLEIVALARSLRREGPDGGRASA